MTGAPARPDDNVMGTVLVSIVTVDNARAEGFVVDVDADEGVGMVDTVEECTRACSLSIKAGRSFSFVVWVLAAEEDDLGDVEAAAAGADASDRDDEEKSNTAEARRGGCLKSRVTCFAEDDAEAAVLVWPSIGDVGGCGTTITLLLPSSAPVAAAVSRWGSLPLATFS